MRNGKDVQICGRGSGGHYSGSDSALEANKPGSFLAGVHASNPPFPFKYWAELFPAEYLSCNHRDISQYSNVRIGFLGVLRNFIAKITRVLD